MHLLQWMHNDQLQSEHQPIDLCLLLDDECSWASLHRAIFNRVGQIAFEVAEPGAMDA